MAYLSRLKQRLSLPKIEPRPPCPPRTYQHLYGYLDSQLSVNSKARLRSERDGAQNRAANSSPSKNVTLSKPTTPRRSEQRTPLSSRRNASQRLSRSLDVPQWTMPVIRKLCTRMGAPAAPHHIYAGVSSILSTTKDQDMGTEHALDIDLPVLITAVYFFVYSRLSGQEISHKELSTQVIIALEILHDNLPVEVSRFGINEPSFKNHMRLVVAHKWVDMDWFQNIQVGSGLALPGHRENSGQMQTPGLRGGDAEDQEQSHIDADTEDTGPIIPSKRKFDQEPFEGQPDCLRPGLGTMMQEAVDYLSVDHRREFAEWKADILEEIRQKKLASTSQS